MLYLLLSAFSCCLHKNTVTGKVKNKENKTEDFRGENVITLFILHFHKSACFFLNLYFRILFIVYSFHRLLL